MPSDKPWESYKSDDPKVLAEQERTKKLKDGKIVPPPALPAKPPTATSAWGQANKFKDRNEEIAKKTKKLREAIPGQGQ